MVKHTGFGLNTGSGSTTMGGKTSPHHVGVGSIDAKVFLIVMGIMIVVFGGLYVIYHCSEFGCWVW